MQDRYFKETDCSLNAPLILLYLAVRSYHSQIRLVQTLGLDSVWGQSPPTELLSWVTSCPKGGDGEVLLPWEVGGWRSEVATAFSGFKACWRLRLQGHSGRFGSSSGRRVFVEHSNGFRN